MTEDARPDSGPAEVDESAPAGSAVVEELEALEVEESSDRKVWLLALIPEWLGALVLIALTLGVTYNVVARFIGHGITGVVELAGVSMIVMVLLGMSALAMRDGHVRLELIDPLLKPTSLKVVNITSVVVQLVVGAVLTYAMYETFSTDLKRGTTIAGDVQMPRMYISGLAMVCFAILEVSLVRKLITDLRRRHHSVLSRSDDEVDTAAAPADSPVKAEEN